MATRLGIVGAFLLGLGLLAGFVPFTSGIYDCGSAFVPSSREQEFARVKDMQKRYGSPGPYLPACPYCDDLRWLVRIPAFALVGAGGIVLVRCWYVATQSAGRASRAGDWPTTPT
jgi:hypothetical protein